MKHVPLTTSIIYFSINTLFPARCFKREAIETRETLVEKVTTPWLNKKKTKVYKTQNRN